jgi:hypothetical protein
LCSPQKLNFVVVVGCHNSGDVQQGAEDDAVLPGDKIQIRLADLQAINPGQDKIR